MTLPVFALYDTAGAGPYPANVVEAKLVPGMPPFEPSGAPAGDFGVDLEPGQTTVGYVAYIVPKTAQFARALLPRAVTGTSVLLRNPASPSGPALGHPLGRRLATSRLGLVTKGHFHIAE